MKPGEMRDLPPRATRLVPVEPATPAAGERLRSLMLVADSPDTGHVARRQAREAMCDWGLAQLADDVELCVSELVGNAMHHAMPDGRSMAFGGERLIGIAFRRRPRWLFVEVSDEDSTPPMLPVGDLLPSGCLELEGDDVLQDSGRGLFLVQCLATAVWWAPRDSGGKSVFCRFDLNGRDGT